MNILVVVDNPKNWRLKLSDVQLISARAYLTDPRYAELRDTKVFNLCRSYRYQSAGYYVSLLAMARRHKVLPNITTIQDLKTLSITRILADDMADLIQKSLKPLRSNEFSLSVYFGRNVAHRYDELCQRLFRYFPVPLMQAEFERRDGEWRIVGVRPIAAGEIPLGHADFVEQAAAEFFAKKHLPRTRRQTARYDLAILVNPDETFSPSDKPALKLFEAAAKRAGFSVEFIERQDYGRIPEFDALFIRETTTVNHHTYRFARRAAAEGLVVIDDPESIVKCTNKVYLAELMTRNKIPIPRTLIVHKENREQVSSSIGLPCILKQPDSSFSQGVVKAANEEELQDALEKLLDESDLVIAQEFMPTAFDWRIGIIDRTPLYACKYYMVKEHWQIAGRDQKGRPTYGRADAVELGDVPRDVLSVALRATRLIGDGLYGVDIKEIEGKPYLIEINDNPTIESEVEDRLLGPKLYDRIIEVFLKRIQRRKEKAAPRGAPNGGELAAV